MNDSTTETTTRFPWVGIAGCLSLFVAGAAQLQGHAAFSAGVMTAIVLHQLAFMMRAYRNQEGAV